MTHTRRGFLKSALAASAMPALIPASSSGGEKAVQDFNRKTIALFGDSLTATNNWQQFMQRICNFKRVDVLARDGATWSNYPETVYKPDAGWNDPHNCVVWNQYNDFIRRIKSGGLEIPDYIFMMAGSNDGFWGKRVGRVDDTVSISDIIKKEVNTVVEISESVAFVVGLLQKDYPAIKIIIGTPPVQPRINNPDYMQSIASIIKETAKYCEVPCVDVFTNCGITSLTASGLLWGDGVHLNEDGAKLVGEYIAREFCNKLAR